MVTVLAVLAGPLVPADLVWSFADGAMALVALVDLVAIGLLCGVAFTLLRDDAQQRRAGLDPVFTRDRLPEVRGIEVWEDELSVIGQVPVAGAR